MVDILCKSETNDRCRLCLTTERTMSTVEGVLWAYQVVTDSAKVRWTSQVLARVCWECRAVLVKIQKFKLQALKAQRCFDDFRTSGNIYSLSQLAVNTKTYYDTEHIYAPDNEAYDIDDGKSESKMFDPKIEIDIGDDEITLLDVWADPVAVPKEEEGSDGEVLNDLMMESVEIKREPNEAKNVPTVKSRRNVAKGYSHKNKIKTKMNADEKHIKSKAPKVKRKKFEKETKSRALQKQKKVDSSGTCHMCGGARRKRKKSLESQSVKEEQISCTTESLYKCGLCDLTFEDKNAFARHNRENHSEVGVTECTCDADSRDESLLKRIKVPEKSEDGTYDCDVCGARLKSEEYFRLHYEPHVSDKRFECDTCGGVYKTRTQMFRHLMVHRPPMYLCDVCGKRLPKISTLKTHFLSHASLEERPHKCNICARTFITRDKLTIHVRFHDKVKPFKCKLCPYEFYVNFELTRHMKTHHCIGDTGEKAKREKLKRTVSLCRNKRMNRDETGAQKKNSGVKPLLKQNKGRGNGGDLRCNICGKTFSQKVCLDAHVVVHTGDRPFKCEECGQAFKFQSNVLTHARSVHRADKLHQCTICGAQFKLKGNLTAHMKIHSGEKPFACDICDQKFIRSRNLRNHYKVHTK